MFNVGGGELLVILLVALLVLGPTKLPGAARQVGKLVGELRRISHGFQTEIQNALDDSAEAGARERGRDVARPKYGSGTDDQSVSTAERAGMRDLPAPPAAAPTNGDTASSDAGDSDPPESDQ